MDGFKQEKIDALYHLIQSLSDHEVAKVNDYARIFNKNANQIHMQMFRFLRDATGYDHKELKAAFPGKQVSRIKNHLFKFIFRSLAISGLQDHSELSWLIGEISIAMKKKHPIQALASIKEAKEMAEERELFLAHLNALDWERKWVMEYREAEKQAESLETISREYKEVRIKKENLDHFFDLKVKYNLPIKNQGLKTGQIDPELLDQLAEEEALKSDHFPKSDRARVERFLLLTLYHRGKQDFSNSLSFAEREIEVFEQNDWLKEEEQERYYNNLHRASLLASVIEQKEKALQYLERLKDQEDDSFNTARLLWEKLLIAATVFTAKFKEGGEFILPYYKKWIDHLAPHLREKNKILVLWPCLRALMEIRSYQDAKRFVYDLLQVKSQWVYPEMEMASRIMHLVILYEEQDEIGLDSFGRNYQRKLKKLRNDQDIAFHIIRFLRYSPRYEEKGTSRKKMEELSKILADKSTDPETKHFLNHFDFKEWLEEKLK